MKRFVYNEKTKRFEDTGADWYKKTEVQTQMTPTVQAQPAERTSRFSYDASTGKFVDTGSDWNRRRTKEYEDEETRRRREKYESSPEFMDWEARTEKLAQKNAGRRQRQYESSPEYMDWEARAEKLALKNADRRQRQYVQKYESSPEFMDWEARTEKQALKNKERDQRIVDEKKKKSETLNQIAAQDTSEYAERPNLYRQDREEEPTGFRLNRETRDSLIKEYEDALSEGSYERAIKAQGKVLEAGGIERLYQEQMEDASKDARYRASLHGVDLDDLSLLERAARTIGNTFSAAGKQMGVSGLGLAESEMNRGAMRAEDEYPEGLKTVSNMLFYGYLDDPDADYGPLEDQIRTLASYMGGDDYADRLLNRIREQARQGKETGNFNLDDLWSGLDEYNDNKQWERTQKQIESTGVYDAIKKLQESSARDIERAKDYNPINEIVSTKVADDIIDAGVSVVQNLGDAAATAALGLTGTGPLAMIPFAVRAYGGGYAEGIQTAQDLGQSITRETAQKAARYGIETAAIETATELVWSIGGVMGKMTGGNQLDDLAMQKLTQALDGLVRSEWGNKALLWAGQKILGGATEGAEEVLGDLANWLLNTSGIMTGAQREKLDINDLVHSFAVGAISGLGGDVTGLATRSLQRTKIGTQLKNGGVDVGDGQRVTLDEIVDLANDESMKGTALQLAYDKLYSGLPRNQESISDYELGKIYEAYAETMDQKQAAIMDVQDALSKVEEGKALNRKDINKITRNQDAIDYLSENAGLTSFDAEGSLSDRRDALTAALEALASDSTGLSEAQAENVQPTTYASPVDDSVMQAAVEMAREQSPLSDMTFRRSGISLDNNLQAYDRAESSMQRAGNNMVRDAFTVADAAERLGVSSQAQDVMAKMHMPNQETIDYAGEMTKYYNQGKSGNALEIGTVRNISPAQAQAAYNVGRMENIQEEANNARTEEERVPVRAGVQEFDSTSAGGQSRRVEESSGSVELREGTAGFERSRPIPGVYSGPVSARQLGIAGGSSRANLRIVTNSSNKQVQRAQQLVESSGMKFVAFTGGALEIDGTQARGYYDPTTNTIYVRADHRLFTADQIARHEVMHDRIRKGEVNLTEAKDDMISRLGGAEKFEQTMRNYYALYEGTGMSYDAIFEEAICDAAGDMNEFVYSGHWEDASAAVPFYKAAKEAGKSTSRIADRGTSEDRGGQRFSADRDYGSGTARISTSSNLGRTSIDFDPSVHTEEEKRIFNEYVKALDNDLLRYIRESVAGNVKETDRFQIGKVSQKQAALLFDLTGVDYSGYGNAIASSEVRHIESRHGENGKADQTMIPEDLARIGYVLANPDSSKYSDSREVNLSKNYSGADGQRAKAIQFSKKIDGTYYVVLAVAENRRKKLRVLSAFMEKQKSAITGDSNADLSALQRTSETSPPSLALSGESVTEPDSPVKKKFSMDRPVEHTDRLIALHNMSEDTVKGMLELGGLAMPSVAITRADMGHSTYGEISAVYGRSSISPTNRKNVIYSGDAYTPTFPDVGLKINRNAAEDAYDKVSELLGENAGQFHLALDSDNLQDQIKRYGSFYNAYKDRDAFKIAFLRDTGRTLTIPTKEKSFSNKADNQTLKRIAKALNLKSGASYSSQDTMAQEPEVRRIMREYAVNKYGENIANKLYPAEEAFSFSEVDSLLYAARNLLSSNQMREVDKKRLEKRLDIAMKTKKIQAEYESWMNELGKDFVEKKGIRNNQDFFTPYGNRRSFEQLYYPYTLANVVRAMEGQVKQGKTGPLTGSGNIRGAAAKPYASIEDARRDIGRLNKMDYKEAVNPAIEAFDNHTLELCQKMVEGKGGNKFTAVFDAAEVLTEVIPKYQTADGIYRYLKREGYDGWYNVTPEIAREIEDVIKEARQLPTSYFEGKMYRAVPITEALAYVVPDNMNKELKQQLIDAGGNVVEYKHDNESDRLAKVNSIEGARFSRDTDSSGKELSEGQKEYFAESKVRDKNGALKVMYQGSNEDFTVFDRKKSKGSNLYGRGFYFTDDENRAKTYGKTKPYYLNIVNPLSPGQNKITKQQMRNFLEAVKENEDDYDFINYGQNTSVNAVLNALYGKGDFEMLQDVSATAIGDMVASVELFNEVNGTDYDGLIMDTETVVFNSEQAKNTDNLNPTISPDVRYSMDIDTYLQEQYAVYRTDKENLRLAEKGIRDLEEGSKRISDAKGVSDAGRDGKVPVRDGRGSGRDIRTIGRGITERFIQKGSVNLNGNKVSNAEDVARMCQIFRNPQFETVRYLYVKNGEIVGMDAVSSRLPGLSVSLAKDFNQHDLVNKITRVKADGFYMLHNHPSGEVTPSSTDITTTRSTAAGIQGIMGVKMLGHVIIDHEAYSVIDSSGNVTKHDLSGQKSFDWLTVPEIDNENLSKSISDPSDVAAIAKAVRDEDMSVIVYANAQGKVIQIQEISDKTMKNNSQIANYIRNQIRDSGGQMTFLYTKNRDVYNKMSPEYVNGTFLDIILDNQKIYLTAHRTMKQDPDMYLGKDMRHMPAYVNERAEEYGRASRDLSTSDLYEANRQLQKDLTELRQLLKTRTAQKEYWKGQTKVTQGRQVRTEDVTRLAKDLLKTNNSTADVDAVTKKLKALGEYILNVSEDQADNFYDDVRMKSYEIAHDILDEAKILQQNGGEHFYKDFRDRLRSYKVYIAPSIRNDINPDGWNAIRQMAKGILTPTADKTKGTTIDVVYHDLQQEFGEWLLPDDIINEADQLEQIFEAVETYRPIYENLNSYEMAEAVEWTANEILTRIIGNEIRETNPTYADRMEKKLADQKLKSQEALRKVRDQRDKRVADLKAHYQEVAEKRRERKADSAARTRLLHIVKRLKNKKLTRVQRSLLDQYIKDLDTVSKSMTKTSIADLQALEAWYKAYEASMGEDFIPDKFIEKKLERLRTKKINDLTQEEVADLTTVLLNIENMIRTENELIESQIRKDIYAAGEQTIEDIRNSNGKTGFLNKYISTETATPEREVHRITGYRDNSPLYVATQELSKGQRDMLDYQRRAEKLFKPWTTDKAFVKSIAGKKAKTITVKGVVNGELTDVEITPAMRMALYLHEKNDDNMTHISKSGVKIPNMELYKQGKVKEAYDKGQKVVFTRSMIKEIASHMSDQERAFANTVHAYYNGMSRESINEISEKLKGYSIAGVENYYPIDTDGTFLKKEFDSIKHDGSIEGMGFLKERVTGATNPIMLYDMNDTLAKSISQHSKYYGLAIPVRNFQKLWSMQTSRYADEKTSVQEALAQNWGQDATNYIAKMMADIQNGVAMKDRTWGPALAKARSRYAGAVLNTNAAVAMKQAASYPTAAAVIGYAPLIKALKDTSKIDLDKLAEYTPLLWYRSKGFSTMELGDIGKEGRHIPQALNWIQAIDVATTTKLAKAAMYYVNTNNKDLARNTDSWWREVANVYNRIIEETQPNYTMMQRPQILRSDSDAVRALNMFRTQPFQNFNILYDAFGNLAAKTREYKAVNSDENLNALQDARKTVARAVSSQIISAFEFSLMQFLWDAFRGKLKKYKDDDDEMTLASWLKGMGINVLSSAGGMIPFVGPLVLELGETMTDAVLKAFGNDPFFDQKFYGLSENAAESINDMGNALINMVSKAARALEGGEITESTIRSVVDSMADMAQFAGIPMNNVIKLAQAIARNAFLATDGKYIGGYKALRVTTDPAKYSSDYYDLLYKAYKEDPAAYDQIMRLMLEDSSEVFTESKIKSNMEKRMKQSQGVSSVDELDVRWMSPNQQETYDKALAEISGNNLWQQATDEQQQKVLDKLYDLATGNDSGQKLQEKIAGGKDVGIDQAEYLLYTIALQMADDGNGSYTQKEAEAAANMLSGLSDAEKAYLFQSTNKGWKKNPFEVTRGVTAQTSNGQWYMTDTTYRGAGGYGRQRNITGTGKSLYTRGYSVTMNAYNNAPGTQFYLQAYGDDVYTDNRYDIMQDRINERRRMGDDYEGSLTYYRVQDGLSALAEGQKSAPADKSATESLWRSLEMYDGTNDDMLSGALLTLASEARKEHSGESDIDWKLLLKLFSDYTKSTKDYGKFYKLNQAMWEAGF